MRNKKLIASVLIISIFLLGLFLRLYRIDLNSPELYADETGGHYTMYQILKHLPANPLSALYNLFFYGTFSLTWVFGLTPLGVRLAPALWGSLICLVLYLFATAATPNDSRKKLLSLGLLTALLGAVLPWGYMISRIGHTHIPILVLLTTLHLFLLLRATKIKEYLISLVPLGISLFYYSSMVIIGPVTLLLTALLIFFKLNLYQRKIFVSIFVIGLIFVTYIFLTRYSVLSTAGRGLDLAIWRDPNVTADNNEFRGIAGSTSPSLFSFGLSPETLSNKLVYNYPLSVINVYVRNYLSFFSPDFLFLKGDPVLRHSTGQMGALFPVLLPFLLFGVYSFYKSGSFKTKLIFTVWILISPVPAAITKDGAGYLLRVITLMPFLTYFCALGIIEAISNFRSKLPQTLVTLTVSLLLISSAYSFYYGYFHVYPALAARSYETGFKDLSDYSLSSGNPSTLVIWDGFYPYLHYLFWQKTPFDQFQQIKVSKLPVNNTIYYQTLPFLYFSLPKNEKDLTEFLADRQIQILAVHADYAARYPQILNQLGEPVKLINYPDGTPNLYLYQLR